MHAASEAGQSALRFDRAHWLSGLCLCLVTALFLWAGGARAQTVVSPTIAQVFDGGGVNAVAIQADGKVIIGGSFAHVGGVARNNIARLNSDGSVDLTWNPDASDSVGALALDGAGNVYAAGGFSSIGGQSRNGMAKLSTTGTGLADAAWNPSAAGFAFVNALVLDGGGNLYVGGFFSSMGGLSRNNIARLSTSGSGAADATWNPNPDSSVSAMALDGGGNLYVAGDFSSIGGQSRNRIGKVSTSGTGLADATWNPNAGFSSSVNTIVLDGGGNVYAGGTFTSIGGLSRNNIAKLSTSGAGAADPTWNPNSSDSVTVLRLDGSGNLYAGGNFSTIGGLSRTNIARLSIAGSGAADAAWNPSAKGFVGTIALDGSGKAYVGGAFQILGGVPRGGFATVSTTSGAADSTSPLVLGSGGDVQVIVRDGNGRTIIGGSFLAMGDRTTPRLNIARFNADRTLDLAWNPAADGGVVALAVDGSNDIYAGGGFTSIGGQSRNFVAKLSGVGGLADATWNPDANSSVGALALDGSGNVYAGGAFTNIGGQSRNRLAKLSATGAGAADPTWNPGANGSIHFVALDGGNVFVGGFFVTTIGGQSRRIAKLPSSGTGSADPTWNPAPSGFTYALVPDGLGNIYAAGTFSSIGGQSRSFVARLSTTGTGAADPVWNPNGVAVDGGVFALALDGGGNVHVGGSFTSIGGLSRVNIARLSPSGTGAADAAWNPNPNSNDVNFHALLAEGSNIHVGGDFKSIAGQSRSGYAVLAPLTPPGAPTIGSTLPGNAQATVAFTAPASNGGSPVTGYTATCNPGSITASSASSPIVVTGLANGTPYTCAVTASNVIGTGAPSGTVLVTPSATPYSAPFAFIANASSNNVSVIHTGTTQTVALVATAAAPYGVAVNPYGNFAYVSMNNANQVAVINTTTFALAATITVGSFPRGIAINPAGTRVYTANYSGNTVSVINTATNTVIATVPGLPTSPEGIAVNSAGTRVYVANNGGCGGCPSNLSTIDTATNTVIASVGVGSNANHIALNPAGTRAYVEVNEGLAVVDLTSNTVVTTVPISAWAVAVNPAGTRVYVSSNGGNTVTVLDAATNAVITTIPVGLGPNGISVDETGSRVYVANISSNDVSVINTATNSVVATVPVGSGPRSYGRFIGGVPPTAPQAPTITSAVTGNGQVTIAFTPPAFDGGAPITGYTVTCNPGSITATGASSPIVVTGLTNGVSYSCTVTASNSAGVGTSSAATSGLVPQPPTIAIATSSSHTLALDSTGKVYAWGSDNYGQLGQGRATIRAAPTQLAGIPLIDHVSLAGHALAVDIHKQVWSWGDNACGGQLGPRSTAIDSKPARVTGAVSMIRAAAGACFSVAVRTDGTVWGWGDVPGYVTPVMETFETGIRQLTDLAGIVDVVAGHAHALARTGAGAVFAFGENSQGELGLGTTGSEQRATQITGLPPVAALAAARQSSLALTTAGQIYFWGKRANGAIVASPLALPPHGGTAVSIALTDGVPYVVRDDGSVRVFDVGTGAWQPTVFSGSKAIHPSGANLAFSIGTGGQLSANGSNDSGQLGLGDTNPHGGVTPVTGFTSTKMMAVSELFPSVLALKTDGTLWFWGADTLGQAGDGTPTSSSVPLAVTIPATIKAVAAGDRFSIALDTAGNVWGWGDNRSGPFGASVSSRSSPTLIAGVSGVQAIAAGGPGLVLYLLANGTVMMSGTLAPYVSGSAPIAVGGLSGVTAIAAGTSAYAVKSDGLYAWGANGSGELGNNTVTGSSTPVPVQGIAGTVTRVSAGNNRASAVTNDGKVWAWGSGLLGNGTSGGSLIAVNVGGISDAADVSVGQSATLVRRQGGAMYAWGNTGLAGSGASLSPYSIAFHQPVLAVRAGAGHSLGFIIGNGGVAWGFGFYQSISAQGAAMGDGTYVSRDRPVLVLAPGGGGNLNTNNWFLDLDPAAGEIPPAASTPGVLGIARLFGSEAGVSLQATIKYKTTDFGNAVNLYALALVPAQFFEVVATTPGTPPMEKLRELEKNGGGFVLAQLGAAGTWGVVQGQFEAYRQAVAGPFGNLINVLDNTPLPQLQSGRFCVGYGDSAEAMLSLQQLREVLNLQGGTTPQGSGLPCILIGVYVQGNPTSAFGTPAAFTASVVGVLPEGEVRFTKASEPLRAWGPLESRNLEKKNDAVSSAQLSTSALPIGVHYIGATFIPSLDDRRNPATFADPPLRHAVASTSTIVLSGPGKSAKGEPVVFESIVTGNNPGGNVMFRSNGTDLGEVPVRQGKASFHTETLTVPLAVGSHNITAHYPGDGANAASTSNIVVHEVTEAVPISVTVSASTTFPLVGDAVTFTVTVTGVGPSGTVTFREGNTILGTANLSNGSASITVNNLTGGPHNISADFTPTGSGDRVTSNNPANVVVSVPGEPTFIPTALDFGTLPLGTTSGALQATLVNSTGGALAISSVNASTGFSVTTHTCTVIAAGASCAAMVTFTPTEPGTLQGSLTFQTSVGARSVSLTGAGIVNAIPALVSHYYLTILGRPSDPGGQAFWEAQATRMVGLGVSVREAFFAMSLQFFNSGEYTSRNTSNTQYVTDLYRTFFIREPDTGGLAFWENYLNLGVDRGALLANFLFSPEFAAFMTARFGSAAVRPEVDMTMDFYRGILGTLPDSGGYTFWLGQLRTAQCQGAAAVTAKASQLAQSFSGSAEYAAREAARPSADRTRMYVGDLYNAFLRRGAEPGGYNHWVNQILGGFQPRDNVRIAFVNSPEFQARVNAVIAAGCVL